MIKQKLPLLVLYEHQESWFVEDDKPIAIFLEPDRIALSAESYPKMQYGFARRLCEELDICNLYWQVPTTKMLQAMLDYRPLIDQTAALLKLQGLHNSRYWGCQKLNSETRLGLNLALEREEELDVYAYAFIRPFLRLS